MSKSSISDSLSLLMYEPYVPPCLLGESELCTLLLRPERLRKATALLIRSLPLLSERDGVGGTILAGLLSAPESEDIKRVWTSAEMDVRARGREPCSLREESGSRQKSGGAEFLLLCFLRVVSVSSTLKVALGSALMPRSPKQAPGCAGEAVLLQLRCFLCVPDRKSGAPGVI